MGLQEARLGEEQWVTSTPRQAVPTLIGAPVHLFPLVTKRDFSNSAPSGLELVCFSTPVPEGVVKAQTAGEGEQGAEEGTGKEAVESRWEAHRGWAACRQKLAPGAAPPPPLICLYWK